MSSNIPAAPPSNAIAPVATRRTALTPATRVTAATVVVVVVVRTVVVRAHCARITVAGFIVIDIIIVARARQEIRSSSRHARVVRSSLGADVDVGRRARNASTRLCRASVRSGVRAGVGTRRAVAPTSW
jgi:hypothetical protein